MTNDISRELAIARKLAQQAGEIILSYRRQPAPVYNKSDGTLVTEADRRAEQLIRSGLAEAFEGDAILGEETCPTSQRGLLGPIPGRRWIIDPIHGTASYVRGLPYYATYIALVIGEELQVAVIHSPAQGTTLWAESGRGAYMNGERLSVSKRDHLKLSQFNFGELNNVSPAGLEPGFSRLIAGTERQRGYGDCLGFTTVFEGKAEIMLEPLAAPWDVAPMKLFAAESGGRYCDLKGGQSIYAGGCLVTNAAVYDEVVAELFGCHSAAQPPERVQSPMSTRGT